MSGPVRVRDATPRMGADLIANDFVRTGEAAVAIDPLSSQGIQEALLAAIQASAAVHTMLTPDGDHTAALEFYRERRQAAATRGRLNAARFYQPHADRSSFWMRRSLAADGVATGHARTLETLGWRDSVPTRSPSRRRPSRSCRAGRIMCRPRPPETS